MAILPAPCARCGRYPSLPKGLSCPGCGEPYGAPPPAFEQRSILAEAGDVVHGDRRKDYGSPLENHDRTAKLWSAYLGVTVTAEDVCMLNILQKVSRARHALKRDNLVDIAGYAANVELIENERKKT